MLKEKGFKTYNIDEVKHFVGNGVRLLVSRALPEGSNDELINNCFKRFAEIYDKNKSNNTKPYNGIIDLIKNLYDMEIKTAIVSNKYDPAVKELCKEFFYPYIKTAIGESATIRKKPAPDGILEAIKELGANIEKTIFVGDSEVDLQTAHNANVKVVGVTWGFRSREILIENNPWKIIDKPSELLNVIV